MWDYDKRTALHLVINLKRNLFDSEWGGRVGSMREVGLIKKEDESTWWLQWFNRKSFFQDFLSTPKYVFHRSTKDNAKFLFASPFLSFRPLLITPFDCIRRLPILIRFLHLQSMIDYVNNVNIWGWKIARPLRRGTLSVSSSLLRLVGWGWVFYVTW